jgi:hypothetical protein
MASAELDFRALKKVIDSILDHLTNDLKIENLPLKDDQDFYWEVPSDELHAVKEAQPQLDVGRLRDDWEFLQSVAKDPGQASSLMLIHVAPLLRHIGEKVGQ